VGGAVARIHPGGNRPTSPRPEFLHGGHRGARGEERTRGTPLSTVTKEDSALEEAIANLREAVQHFLDPETHDEDEMAFVRAIANARTLVSDALDTARWRPEEREGE
jgi:hypothetical protein